MTDCQKTKEYQTLMGRKNELSIIKAHILYISKTNITRTRVLLYFVDDDDHHHIHDLY